MPTKLHQIVAVEKGEKERTNKSTAPLFQLKPADYAGLTKTYDPVTEGDVVYPPESTRVRYTVPEVLDRFKKPTTKMLDVILTKETANQTARADVVVNGETLFADVPVSFLLQLEKYLEREVRGLITSLPTIDPAYDWEPSDTERRGMMETEPTKRQKTKKLQRPLELAPATDKHAAQVQLITEDIVEGWWTEKKFSGAITGRRKQELTERVDALIDAVKFAREKANDMEVEDKTIGNELFAHLFA